MHDSFSGEFDFEAALASMGIPSVPAEALERVPVLKRRLARWDRVGAIALLSGLQTEPALQANSIRLCWATRLILSAANGTHLPTRTDLMRLLNVDFAKAGINRREDPNEDFFAEPIATSRGEFQILVGTWHNPASFTDNLLQAFEALSDAPPKTAALDAAYALIAIGDLITKRAGLQRRHIGDGNPQSQISIPGRERLQSYATRVFFTWAELSDLGIEPEHLAPFALSTSELAECVTLIPGTAPVDFRPMLYLSDGVLVASPTNISTAVRAHLIECAVAGHVEEALQYQMLAAQARMVSETRFVDLDRLPVMKGRGHIIRNGFYEESAGRYVHVLQIADDFEDWKTHGFGVVAPSKMSLELVLEESALAAKKSMEQLPGYKRGMTLLMMGGWGRGRTIGLPEHEELKDWLFLSIEPADAVSISGCDHGKIADLWRLHQQLGIVQRQGFHLENQSGTLNLFHWWRESDNALVPPQRLEMTPPYNIVIPTDSLLEARREGQHAHDRRAVRHPDGSFRIMLRLDPTDVFGGLDPIYGSYESAGKGVLLGVVLVGAEPAWIRLQNGRDDPNVFESYQTWRTALHWLEAVMPAFEAEFGKLTSPTLINLDVAWPQTLFGDLVSEQAIDASVVVEGPDSAGTMRLRLAEDWQLGLRHTENRAEVSLAAGLLSCLTLRAGVSVPQAELLNLARRAAGSVHTRWRHTFVVNRVIDELRAHGLAKTFYRVPLSAIALMKCGGAFAVEGIRPGSVVEGKSQCFKFLMALHQSSLDRLCDCLQQFDRQALVTRALSGLQTAFGEESLWKMTARALRSIHGVEEDERASLDQRNQINSCIRSCSIIAEVAASHAPLENGQALGYMDFDELQAMALAHFGICELVPALQGDLMEPRFAVSPTGDFLFDHSFGEQALVPSVRILHTETRQESDESYASFNAPTERSTTPDENLLAALSAEFGVPHEVYFTLSGALGELAVGDRTDVLVLRRSELLERLGQLDYAPGQELDSMVDRLTLPARNGWADQPPYAKPWDFDVGRFDRRYSLIGRPIIALTADADPLLAIAPAMVERAALHNSAGAWEGRLQSEFWTSKEMGKFVGGAAEKLGMAFNERVAAEISKLGLIASPSVKPSDCLNHKATARVKGLGDIDVLALTPDGQHAWVIEAKDIKLCRTLAETAKRLAEYRGKPLSSGKPDNLLRHLNRVDYLRTHAADLAKRKKLHVVPQVHGLLVVDTPQPMTFVPHASRDATFVRLTDIGNVPWHGRGKGKGRKK